MAEKKQHQINTMPRKPAPVWTEEAIRKALNAKRPGRRLAMELKPNETEEPQGPIV